MMGADDGHAVTVELLGLARALTRKSEVTVRLRPDATLQDVVAALLGACPVLLGPVLTKHGGLQEGTVFSLDGRGVTRELGVSLSPPARILLLTTMEGG